MRNAFLASTVLIAAFILGGAMAVAQDQQPKASRFQLTSADLAVTYTTERSNVTLGGGDFWLQGGSIDGALTLGRGIGLATNITGDFTSRIGPGVGLVELSALAGPRYTRRLASGSKHETRVFGELLAGAVRASDSSFPKASGFDARAGSFAYQAGGGLDISISKHLAIRAIEADYVRSYLPNNGTNTQSHLRLAFGLCLHSGK